MHRELSGLDHKRKKPDDYNTHSTEWSTEWVAYADDCVQGKKPMLSAGIVRDITGSDYNAYSTEWVAVDDHYMPDKQSMLSAGIVREITGSDYKRKKLDECLIQCPHYEVLNDNCVQCGKVMAIDYGTSFDYIQKGLKVSPGFVDSLRQDHTMDLIVREKLHLVLDLDQTLIHSVREKYLKPEEYLFMGAKDLQRCVLPDGSVSIVKLRPFVLDFLEKASAMFEMSIYTNSNSGYAARIVSLLDPQGKYFKGRVIAREQTPYRKTLDLILTQVEAIVVVDDRKEMWPDCQPNVIEAARYEYFAWKTKNKKGGSSHCMNKTDESEMDGELANILKALDEIHRQYFSEEIFEAGNSDTRLIVPDVVSTVLGRS